jgi:hypothetical protein
MPTKAEEKRAAIVAKQAARELAERGAQQAGGLGSPDRRTGSGKRRTNWAASPPMADRRRGRPPKPQE